MHICNIFEASVVLYFRLSYTISFSLLRNYLFHLKDLNKRSVHHSKLGSALPYRTRVRAGPTNTRLWVVGSLTALILGQHYHKQRNFQNANNLRLRCPLLQCFKKSLSTSSLTFWVRTRDLRCLRIDKIRTFQKSWIQSH